MSHETCYSSAQTLLILAAHQDDCVIMAGELAIEMRRAGARVQIVYLTCGSDHPEDSRSVIRMMEAIRAWSMLDLAQDDISCLDLPQSPLGGTCRSTPEQHTDAKESLRGLLQGLPDGSVVVIPADGESHIDHRLLRRLALKALVATGRDDLRVLETPEYNPYYSLRHCGMRSLMLTWGSLPGLGRLVPRSLRFHRAGFPDGPRGFHLRPDSGRLAQKLDMLRAFTSEDGEKLVRQHGTPDLLRPIRDVELALKQTDTSLERYHLFMGVWVTKEVIWFWICLLLVMATALALCAAWLTSQFGLPATVTLSLAGLTLLGMAYLRRRHALRSCMLLTGSAGLLIGSGIAGWIHHR